METEIQYWLSDQEINEIYSGKYWNDEEEEIKKEWYIIDGNTDKLLTYLKERSTLMEEYESIIHFAEGKEYKVQGTGIDVAAGVCWTTALLSRINAVEKMYALEISRHRLVKIAPAVFELFKASKKKIVRILTSFYEIKLPDESIEFCFMSQAFHHANEPEKMLAEVRRILKPNGFILIIGENPISQWSYLKRCLKNRIKATINMMNWSDGISEADKITGDHDYTLRDYYEIFNRCGFKLEANKESRPITFLAIKI